MSAFSPQDQSPRHPDATNTLVLVGLTPGFFRLDVLEGLYGLFASYGEINQWVKLSTLCRIMIVYLEEEDAMRAKIGCIQLIRRAFRDMPNIGLYSVDPSPLRFDTSFPNASYLKVPELEKNFLISPPGSPPAGWQPIKEDPPNSTPLADDIIIALRQLQLRRNYSGTEIILDPDEGSGIGISVENCAEEEYECRESEWNYGERSPSRDPWKPTSLPRLRASISS